MTTSISTLKQTPTQSMKLCWRLTIFWNPEQVQHELNTRLRNKENLAEEQASVFRRTKNQGSSSSSSSINANCLDNSAERGRSSPQHYRWAIGRWSCNCPGTERQRKRIQIWRHLRSLAILAFKGSWSSCLGCRFSFQILPVAEQPYQTETNAGGSVCSPVSWGEATYIITSGLWIQ